MLLHGGAGKHISMIEPPATKDGAYSLAALVRPNLVTLSPKMVHIGIILQTPILPFRSGTDDTHYT